MMGPWRGLFLAFLAVFSVAACVGDFTNTDAGTDGGTTDAPLGNLALTVVPAGNGTGSITSQPVGIDCGAASVDAGDGGASVCTASFTKGTSVVLTATPSNGSTFTGWSGGGCTGSGPCTLGLTAPTTVTATFALAQYALTVAKTGTGTVVSNPAGISCGSTCGGVFDFGTSVTLTAQGGSLFVFGGWSGGGCTGTGTCVVKMTAATNVNATFSALATWDPSWSVAGVTYSNGNLTMSGNSAGNKTARTTVGKSTGKMYWEIFVNAGTTSDVGGLGIAEAAMPNTVSYIGDGTPSGLSFGYYGFAQWFLSWSGVSTPNGNPPTSSYVITGTTYMFALDMSSGNFWVGQNGTWYNGGNPSTNTAPTAIGIKGTVYPAVTFYPSSPLVFTANFGATTFQYAVPTGFQPGFY